MVVKHFIPGLVVILVVSQSIGTSRVRAEQPEVAFKSKPGNLEISVGGEPFATYTYESSKITRPFFAHVKTPAGVQATRNHPPVEGEDPMDHGEFHPGVWQAFGDINGHDYWRLKAKVEHEMFVVRPRGGPGKGTFTVRNYYMSTDGKDRVCAELCKFTISASDRGTFIIYDSTFSSDHGDFTFGDQEEFGVAMRVTTPITVEFGQGHMTNAEGLKDGDEVWAKQSDWIDYSGVVDGTYVGIALMPDPSNFRRSWYHARDYGFIAANPFGRKAMQAGEESAVTVKKGDKLHLGCGVYIYSDTSGKQPDMNAAYEEYLELIGAEAVAN
ncbi:MAG: DUF6807 family protein [Bythopirellula sp.]